MIFTAHSPGVTRPRRWPSALLAMSIILWGAACGLLSVDIARADQPATTSADTLVVVGTKEALGETLHPVKRGDDLEQIQQTRAFRFIRRGGAMISDLYADGFKRNDLTVTVDGERFTTACPNRMDTRVGHIDLLEIEAITLSRTGGSLQSGLGGKVEFRRRRPGEASRVLGRFSAGFDHQSDVDAGLAIEGQGIRFGGRYREGDPYTDADGRTFTEAYNYVQAPSYRIIEMRVHGAWDEGEARGSFESAEDLLFPYLLMDERTNEHWELSGAYLKNRLYFNRSDHMMDNDLRTSRAMTDMRTDATNTMFGAVGDFYEIYGRHWDADNYIIPLNNPAMAKYNHMLPDIWRFGAVLTQGLGDRRHPWLVARAGVIHTQVGDKEQLDKYRVLETGAELERWSVPFGLTASHFVALGEKSQLGLSGELSSDAAAVEAQYIAVSKPGTKPDWIGNPELHDPLRATVRVEFQHELARIEIYGARVWNYTYLTRRMVDAANYQTYTDIDALLAGVHLWTGYRWLSADLSWNWGEHVDGKAPLAEIQPLRVAVTAEAPLYEQTSARLRYVHSAAQHRVDPSLNEMTTEAWNRLDAGLVLANDSVQVALEMANLTNVQYTQHLSYLRSPFSSGLRVYEPGRTFRITASFGY